MELGASLKTAQAFGAVLVVFISTIFLGLTLVQFFLEWGASTIYQIIQVLLPSAFLCQLLTFAGFASKFCSEIVDELDEQKGTVQSTCTPGDAGVMAIFNLVAIIAMTTLMSMVTPPEHPMFQLYGTGNPVRLVSYDSQSSRDRRRQQKREGQGASKHHGQSSYRPRDSTRRGKMEHYVMREPQRRQKIRTTVVNGPGVRKTTKEITHPDGSQTITTTVEELVPYASDTDIIDSDCDGDSITSNDDEHMEVAKL
jgi:hypothetical protein